MEREARRAAGSKLSEILDDFLRAGGRHAGSGSHRSAWGHWQRSGRRQAGQLFDQTEDSKLEDALIQALGEVGRNAVGLATPGS